jgi:hypothetical protein
MTIMSNTKTSSWETTQRYIKNVRVSQFWDSPYWGKTNRQSVGKEKLALTESRVIGAVTGNIISGNISIKRLARKSDERVYKWKTIIKVNSPVLQDRSRYLSLLAKDYLIYGGAASRPLHRIASGKCPICTRGTFSDPEKLSVRGGNYAVFLYFSQ